MKPLFDFLSLLSPKQPPTFQVGNVYLVEQPDPFRVVGELPDNATVIVDYEGEPTLAYVDNSADKYVYETHYVIGDVRLNAYKTGALKVLHLTVVDVTYTQKHRTITCRILGREPLFEFYVDNDPKLGDYINVPHPNGWDSYTVYAKDYRTLPLRGVEIIPEYKPS
jgi:hypothetical protein